MSPKGLGIWKVRRPRRARAVLPGEAGDVAVLERHPTLVRADTPPLMSGEQGGLRRRRSARRCPAPSPSFTLTLRSSMTLTPPKDLQEAGRPRGGRHGRSPPRTNRPRSHSRGDAGHGGRTPLTQYLNGAISRATGTLRRRGVVDHAQLERVLLAGQPLAAHASGVLEMFGTGFWPSPAFQFTLPHNGVPGWWT